MKPVYSPEQIDGFKLNQEQKDFIKNNEFTRKQLLDHLKKIKKQYYKNLDPIGYI